MRKMTVGVACVHVRQPTAHLVRVRVRLRARARARARV